MIKDIGQAIENKILEGESMTYLVDKDTKIEPTQEFVNSLDDNNFLGVFKDKTELDSSPKVRQIPNAAGIELGWQYIDKFDNKITGTLIVLNPNLLTLSGFKKSSDGTKWEGVRGIMDKSMYKDIILINKDLGGEYSIVHCPNMWNKEGIKFGSKNKSEAGFKISLESVDDGVSAPITIYPNFKELAKATQSK